MPLVCTLDNAFDLACYSFLAGVVVGVAIFGFLAILSKWNSL
jgi:hypothetical protein